MLKTKGMTALAELGRKTAIQQAGFVSRFFWYQPKTPAKLLEMKQKQK